MLAVLLINRMISRRRFVRSVKLEDSDLTPKLDCCRTCLGTENLTALFNNQNMAKKRSKDLYSVTGLEIKKDDGLSQKICSKCVQSLELAVQFRLTSRFANKSLQQQLNKKDNYIKKVRKKLVKAPKVESEESDVGNDYEFDSFGTDLQSDLDYSAEDIKPEIGNSTEIEKDQSAQLVSAEAPAKKKRAPPSASSFKCTWCGKEFRMKATYKAHMRFHTNYCVCEACGKRCRNNNQLQEHKRARHGLGKIHKCSYCEYSSATKEALTIHERRHTGERPYVCDHCGATFHRRSNLVQHIAIHLPEKNFQCPICQKKEKSRKRLQVHTYNQHRRKMYRFICPECKMPFSKNYNVRVHLKRIHKIPREAQGAIEKCVFHVPMAEDKDIHSLRLSQSTKTGHSVTLTTVTDVSHV